MTAPAEPPPAEPPPAEPEAPNPEDYDARIDLDNIHRQPDPDIIAGIEDLLAAAQAGHVLGLAIVVSLTGQEVSTWVDAGDAHFADLFLGVAQLQRSMLGVLE